jgi:hypothetical protein
MVKEMIDVSGLGQLQATAWVLGVLLGAKARLGHSPP